MSGHPLYHPSPPAMAVRPLPTTQGCCNVASCAGGDFTVDASIPHDANGGGLGLPGPCVICRQNDPNDHQVRADPRPLPPLPPRPLPSLPPASPILHHPRHPSGRLTAPARSGRSTSSARARSGSFTTCTTTSTGERTTPRATPPPDPSPCTARPFPATSFSTHVATVCCPPYPPSAAPVAALPPTGSQTP